MDKNLNDSGFDIKTGDMSLCLSQHWGGMDEEVLKKFLNPTLQQGVRLRTQVWGLPQSMHCKAKQGTVMVNSMPGKGSPLKLLLPRIRKRNNPGKRKEGYQRE
jgi:hypothetical protein